MYGLRSLQGETPTPLEMSVLYFDNKEHKLKAYDDITLGGTGESQVTLSRHLVKETSAPVTSPRGSLPRMTRFAVDDVVPAAARPTVPLGARFPNAICVGGDPASPVITQVGTHPLFGR